MGEARDGDGRADGGQPPEKAPAAGRREGRLDLNVPQVAGSAVAAVVAAKLASNLGVYGTIVGAGVVSVLGTCGGSILQHFFRRTGRQVQEVAVQARPGVRRIREQAWPRADRTAPTAALPAETAPLPDPGIADGYGDGYGEATSYRAGAKRSWKRPAVAVAVAFGLTMGGITVYEAAAGENISGHGHGTTIGNAVTGHGSGHSGGTPPTPATTPGSGTATDRPTPSHQRPTHPTPTRTPSDPASPQHTQDPTPPPTPTPGTGTDTGGGDGATTGPTTAPTPDPDPTPTSQQAG
ncbi:hypothetical protein [Actinacidiphila bryophytorum]|uniref:hypothetical protein n=1 Tax=Actinacidiphila bryophytorum TaxID=1436133 RepID=UPI002176E761|nr:hypothetical protein [Actinacidiphila bryophytorum]UWE07538.1 hypothetical protein NYE86_01495 [Actinacidiphila bryophytorum]